MGNASSMLTQYDIEEVQEHCNKLFSQQEIVSLFQKFCQLDRNSKGFISADEFLAVPEFAMNPLSQRLLKMVDGLNFKDFVAFLSAFSAKASLHHKIEFIFKLYDVDCNGKVSFNDIIEVLGDSSNSFISDEQREAWRLLSFRSIFRICVASPIHRYLNAQIRFSSSLLQKVLMEDKILYSLFSACPSLLSSFVKTVNQ